MFHLLQCLFKRKPRRPTEETKKKTPPKRAEAPHVETGRKMVRAMLEE